MGRALAVRRDDERPPVVRLRDVLAEGARDVVVGEGDGGRALAEPGERRLTVARGIDAAAAVEDARLADQHRRVVGGGRVRRVVGRVPHVAAATGRRVDEEHVDRRVRLVDGGEPGGGRAFEPVVAGEGEPRPWLAEIGGGRHAVWVERRGRTAPAGDEAPAARRGEAGDGDQHEDRRRPCRRPPPRPTPAHRRRRASAVGGHQNVFSTRTPNWRGGPAKSRLLCSAPT